MFYIYKHIYFRKRSKTSLSDLTTIILFYNFNISLCKLFNLFSSKDFLLKNEIGSAMTLSFNKKKNYLRKYIKQYSSFFLFE